MTTSHDLPAKILMVFAHADDETLLAGALVAHLVAEGHEINILCLSPGEDDRYRRLQKACDELGVTKLETLRYSDGEMWPEEAAVGEVNSLQSKIALVPVSDLAGRISGRVRELAPQAIVTHSVYGDYGHPDHASVHKAVAESISTSPLPIQLYALDWPRWMVRMNSRLMRLGRMDTRRMGPDGKFNFDLSISAVKGESLSIDASGGLPARRVASKWYSREISQGPLVMRMLEKMPLRLQRLFLGRARLRLLNSIDSELE